MGRKSRSRGAHAGATPAIRVLDQVGLPYETVAYTHDERSELGFGLEAAAALGEDPAAVLKTLLVGDGRAVGVCVIPSDRRLDLKSAAHALGMKRVALIEPSDAERMTGYVVGGISPLGQKKRLPTVIDASAERLGTIVVSAGRIGHQLRIPLEELRKALEFTLADLI